jgi:hypothetical protein
MLQHRRDRHRHPLSGKGIGSGIKPLFERGRGARFLGSLRRRVCYQPGYEHQAIS